MRDRCQTAVPTENHAGTAAVTQVAAAEPWATRFEQKSIILYVRLVLFGFYWAFVVIVFNLCVHFGL